jgi:branched-chain amino acid transport system ATP-binding protein
VVWQLQVEDLAVSYGPITALDGVSLSVGRGELLAVLGPNGAGKSTLVKAIAGIIPKKRGRVELEGRDITRLPPERLVRMGLILVPEGRGIISSLTVAENLELGATRFAKRKQAREAIDEVLPVFPVLSQKLRARAASLSGGEQQMLAIARALAARPQVLILDEPSLGLAPIIVAQLAEVLRDLVVSRGLTIVLIEQNAKMAMSICDRLAVLSNGRLVLSAQSGENPDESTILERYLGLSLSQGER